MFACLLAASFLMSGHSRLAQEMPFSSMQASPQGREGAGAVAKWPRRAGSRALALLPPRSLAHLARLPQGRGGGGQRLEAVSCLNLRKSNTF